MGMKASNKIATFFKYFVLILVGVIMIYPLLWMISATFKDNSEIFAVNSPFYLAIWVHCAFATETYFVYQLVQFMRNVPRDLDEAAAIDGCSSFQTLYKVIVPMLMPALVSCALFQFMWSCNAFMGPLLYVSTPGKYPMSLFVKLSMDGDTGFAWNKILALSLISILPQLIVFFCAQDQFVEGISAGAVKG